MTSLADFAAGLHAEINSASRVEESEGFKEDIFTERVIDMITDAGEADGEDEICNCRKRGIKVNAFHLSADADNADLFVSYYHDSAAPKSVPRTQVTQYFESLEGFLERSVRGSLHAKVDESAPEFDVASTIFENGDRLTRARLFFLTDGLVRAVSMPKRKVRGISCEYHVYDIERLYRLVTSGQQRSRINVYFKGEFGRSITCLASVEDGAEYTTLLGFMPGQLLVDLYRRFGTRLLERNVRAFLQARGKINRGIRETILKEPNRFLAYNNGISATAERIEFIPKQDVLVLTAATDFQIVNGGQTTASLYQAAEKDRADVSKICVQIKITVPKRPEEIDILAPKISLYANSQNKVSAADLSANDPFHLKVEELSRTIWAPAREGEQHQTRWFYERARGQYQDARAREPTAGKRANFDRLHPGSQKFTKTDLAKFEMTWAQMPHVVSRGAEKNFLAFTELSRTLLRASPDRAYFETLVVKAILFHESERIVHGFKFGGYRANIVAYAIAWLSLHRSASVDFSEIWRKQNLSPSLRALIGLIAGHAREHIVQPPDSGNVTEWCKRENCWTRFSQRQIQS